MNRWLPVLMILLAAVLLASAASAEAQDVQEALYTTPDDLAVFGDKLYAMCFDGLYTPVEEGWRLALDFNEMQLGDRYLTPLHMDEEDDELYLLASIGSYGSGETIYRVYLTTLYMEWLTGLEPVCTLDLAVEPGAWTQCQGFVVDGMTAYMLLQTDVSSTERSTLYRIDLTTGACTQILQDYIGQLQPWKDGQLIARYRRPAGAQYPQNAADAPSVVSIDPQTGAIVPLAELPTAECGGLIYDAATDAIYAADQSILYRLDGDTQQFTPAGRMLPSTSTRVNMAVIVHQAQYIIADWEDASCLTVTPLGMDQPEQLLRITSNYALSDVIRGFARENPDISIIYVNDAPYGLEDRMAHMQGESAADVYYLSLSTGELNELIAQEAAADLSASATLLTTVSAMYPHMTRSLLKDDGLYALPFALNATMTGYYPHAMSSLGLAEEDLPRTMEELLDFILRWYESAGETHRTVALWEYAPELQSHLFGMILTMQLSLCESRGEPPTFHTPEVRLLLNKLQRVMRTIDQLQRTEETDVADNQAYLQNVALFMDYYDPMPNAYGEFDSSVRPLPLSLTAETEPLVNASMLALYVNPHGENTEAAIRLLEYIALHLPQEFRIAVFPEENNPLEYEFYDAMLNYNLSAVQAAEAQLAQTQDDDERALLEEELRWLMLEQEGILENRWAFGAEDIAAYRAFAPQLVVSTTGVFAMNHPEVARLMERFLNREISTEQFLRELDRIHGAG